jgi:glycine betaine/proline transport system ATP-binding protein
MSIALQFKNVDILFAPSQGNRSKLLNQALSDLAQGATRQQIQERLQVIVGVSDASLSVKTGDISVLMGLSGSGKSTLLRAANRLNPVTRGEVWVRHRNQDIDVAHCSAAVLRDIRRQTVAMMFQQFGLLPWRTVADNVGLGLELRGESLKQRAAVVQEKLALVGLLPWADRMVSELSGGMQQRVGLARAFATDAPILLMDEPFSALDPLIRSKLQDELLGLQQRLKKTIVFVTHDLDEALKLGNQITILEGGRIIQTGSPEDIVLHPRTDYVAEFVQHMNPLVVLTGHMVMTPILWSNRDLPQGMSLDDAGQIRITGQAQAFRVESQHGTLTPSQAARIAANEIAVRPASSSLKDLLGVIHESGKPVLLSTDGQVVGVCGSRETLRALAHSHHQKDRAVVE